MSLASFQQVVLAAEVRLSWVKISGQGEVFPGGDVNHWESFLHGISNCVLAYASSMHTFAHFNCFLI